MKIEKCPICGSDNLVGVHIVTRRLPYWYYIECDDCHCCGKTKLGLKRALKFWNKECKK